MENKEQSILGSFEKIVWFYFTELGENFLKFLSVVSEEGGIY